MNKKTKRQILWELFITFFKIGAFTFGGGYAMIPLMQDEAANKRHWVDEEELTEVIAIAEATPGPISINAATFIGYKSAGIIGSIVATMGVVVPAFTIMVIIAIVLNGNFEIPFIRYAFTGVRAALIAILIKAIIKMFKKNAKGAISYLVMLVAFCGITFFKLNVFLVLVICAVIGLVYSLIVGKKVAE